MPDISEFIATFPIELHSLQAGTPWEILEALVQELNQLIPKLGRNYRVRHGIAVHPSAIIERGVVLNPPVIIGANCFLGAHAYCRGGIFLGEGVRIGPGCEVKNAIIGAYSAAAHFNYIGNSILGSRVNMEAGAVIANHYNERKNKAISVWYQGKVLPTGVTKFGALVGDDTKIGANAVLSPGTLLERGSVVKRLGLIKQISIHPK